MSESSVAKEVQLLTALLDYCDVNYMEVNCATGDEAAQVAAIIGPQFAQRLTFSVSGPHLVVARVGAAPRPVIR